MQIYTRYLFALGLFFSAATQASNWIDSVSLSLGQDDDSNDVQVYRLGLQNQWERSWFNGGAWFVGGYWDAELAYMKSGQAGREISDLFGISLTPVFRIQRDTGLSSGVSPFAEAGVGAHLFTDTRLGTQKFSTAVQFGSIFGLGIGFGGEGQYQLSYRLQHISNAGIKTPNGGITLHLLRLAYSFN